MKIDRQLKLTFALDRDDGTSVYVHATPISAEVFDMHYATIAQVFSAVYTPGGGIGLLAGPRVADKILRDIAKANGNWAGPEGVKNTLLAEILRLTNVFVPSGQGWETLMYEDAKRSGAIDEEDCSWLEAALVFFTVASSMHKGVEKKKVLMGAMGMWGGLTTSLDCMAYRNSLPTLTLTETSSSESHLSMTDGQPASSPPPSTGSSTVAAGKGPSVMNMTSLGSPLKNTDNATS